MEDAQVTTRIKKAVEDFGGLLHDYRIQKQLSLQDMAEIFGYSASYIWRIENHKRFPEMDTKIKMLLAIWDVEEVYGFLEEIVTREQEAN